MNKTMDFKNSIQTFLDNKQYCLNGVRRYEWIFGKTFVSTGGYATTKKYIDTLNLQPGKKVLDVGCGIGGHTFLMAENFDVDVLGVDLSVNMLTVAAEHLLERPHLKNKIKFVLCDITQAAFEDSSFDAIYSRDTILHIENKKELFTNFKRWLRPGGRIAFTDYTRSEKEILADFEKYIEDRNYHLLTNVQYRELLQTTGFVNIKVCDATEQFLNTLHIELKRLRDGKERFLEKFTEDDFDFLEDNWTSKIKRAAEGNQTWTTGYAEKPDA